MRQNYAVSLIDLQGATTWPIVSATFIVLPKNPTDASRSRRCMKFFDWAYTHGDPHRGTSSTTWRCRAVQDSVRKAWTKIVVDGRRSGRTEIVAPDGTDRSYEVTRA